MSENNNNETYDNFNIISLTINDINYFNNFILFKELLQELYIILLNTEFSESENELKLNGFINNFLFEHDLDPKNVFEIMTSNSQNISRYSSLIGYFCQRGIGCKVDKIKAFEIFSNAVKNNQKVESNQFSFDQKIEETTDNDIRKLNEIISLYLYSLFLYKDIILNRKYKHKLHIRNAEKGDPVSQYFVGDCYYLGKRIKRDYTKAFEWYLKSSEGGNIKATYRLGCCYYYGDNIMKDRTKAFELYLKSAEGGYKQALHNVGDCYHNGDGILKDENKAFEWYLKAASKGYGYSQYLVAEYYNDGKSIPKNEEKGFYWNRKAAINDNFKAQYKLAEYYLSDSINKDERKAFKWYLKLANSRFNLRATYLVAKCYRDGIGTDKSQEIAINWIRKYVLSKSYSKIPIAFNDFLNGSDIDTSGIVVFSSL